MNTATFSFRLSISPRFASVTKQRDLPLKAVFSERGLRELSIIQNGSSSPPEKSTPDKQTLNAFARLKKKLTARLNGKPAELTWDELDLRGRSDFSIRIWKAMRRIPRGRTQTYADVADAAGSPLAFRACGRACGANPILLFIPCHRVVGASGLGGFGCGIEWKKLFLALEGVDWVARASLPAQSAALNKRGQ